MTGSIRKRTTKKGNSFEVVLEKGVNPNTGKRERLYKTFHSKREAQAYISQSIADYTRGLYIEPSKLTVAQLCEEWAKCHFISVKDSTKRGYTVNMNCHIIPNLGNILVQQLTSRHIQRMVNEMNDKGLSSRTIRYVMTNLNQILNYAVNNDVIVKNPAKGVVLPKQEKYHHETYDKDELKKLLICSANTSFEAPIMIEAFTGLRRGELLALKWEDIDFVKKVIEVKRNLVCETGNNFVTTPKTQSGQRRIVIPDELVNYLSYYKTKQLRERLRLGGSYHNNGLVICRKNGDYINSKTFSNAFHKFLEFHNLRVIRFHDLRHTHATLLLLEYGTNIKAVSDRLGHSKVQTTMDFYIHSTDAVQKEAVSKLELDLFGETG